MKAKSGISLIAVLMFMLAATTASVVVFKWVGSEGFSSAARLKQSEAYQASESGLDAVQAWLTNKAGDVGEVLYQYDILVKKTQKKHILLTGEDGTKNVLGAVGGSRNQNYKVYLTNAHLSKTGQKKLEFLSIGTARDGSKVSQNAIFSVDGLYQITIHVPSKTKCEGEHCDFNYAFFGGLSANTQGRFSSGVVHGDLKVNGISTNKTLIVTGNMDVQDNGEKNIGCKSATNLTREGDLYVVGNWNARGFTVCGNAYIGGKLSNENNSLKFLRNLYADGGIESRGFSVDSNVTLGGNLTFGNNEKLSIKGNFVMEKYTLDKGELTATLKTAIPKIELSGDPKMEILGSFWSLDAAFSGSSNSNNGYDNLKYLGALGKTLSIPFLTNCVTYDQDYNCQKKSERWFQSTPLAYFSSEAKLEAPTNANKPAGANTLPELASKITACKNNSSKKCVPDPIEVPAQTKSDWSTRGKLLDNLVAANSITGLPSACVRLVLRKDRFVGSNSEDKGLGSHWGARNNTGKNFVLSANECYSELLKNDPQKILFSNGSTDKFLVVRVVNPEQVEPGNAFDGNFIFVFEEDMSKPMVLPATTDESNVFIYFKEGATGDMPLNSSCQSPAKAPCKRNYFIFSEKDIVGSSGNVTINGAIFLANGSKVTGKLPDAQIEFNKSLYDALTQAGAIEMTEEYGNLLNGEGGTGNTPGKDNPPISDLRYIPVASRLLVKLETKKISTKQEPQPELAGYVEPTILVMPRLVRITQNEITSSKPLSSFYSYMFMNKAEQIVKANTANCIKEGEGGGGQLKTGENAKGIYTCKFPYNETISEFYVQVGGENEMEVSISTSKTLIKKGENPPVCAKVSLFTNKTPQAALTVSVTKESGTGAGWKCGNSACAGPYTVTIPAWQQKVDLFDVCPESNPTNNYIVLSLSGNNISQTNNKIKISFGSGMTGKIIRNNKFGTWKDCPSQYMPTGTWINVACEELTVKNPNNEWECELGSLATWKIIDINTGEACKLPSSVTDNGGPFTVSEGINSFEASLEWKKYNLTVSGGTVKLVSSMTGQPEISCNSNCGDTIYHKANYVVTSTALKGYCLNKANNCTTATVDGIVGPGSGESFILNPTANTTITLVNAPPASMTCTLNKTAIKEGQSLSPENFTVTFAGQGCNPVNPTVSFTPVLSKFVKGTETIYASSTACSGLPDKVACSPNLTVEANDNCEYSADFCGGAAFVSVLDNTTATLTSAGKCLFINDFSAIQPALNSTVAINGIENACGSNWDLCPLNNRPPQKDGGYYVYLKSGTINTYQNNGWNGIVKGVKNAKCNEGTATCSISGDYLVGMGIPPPKIQCAGESNYGDASNQANFNITFAGGASIGLGLPYNWNYSNETETNSNSSAVDNNSSKYSNHSFYNAFEGRVVRMYSIKCGGKTLEYGRKNEMNGIVCGAINIKQICTVAQENVGTGINNPITRPNILPCLDGSALIVSKFTTGTSTINNTILSGTEYIINDWINNNTTYFTQRPSAGSADIYVEGKCAGKEVRTSCGKITVSDGTTNPSVTANCTWTGSGTKYTNEATPANPTLTYSGGNCTASSWNNLPPPGTLSSTGNYSPTPNGVSCGGQTPSNAGNISCGTLTVKKAPTINQCTGSTNQNVTLPTKPTPPTVTLIDPSNVCSNNNTPNENWTAIWTVSKNSTDVSNATWENIFDVAADYNNYRVSGKCGNYPTNLTYNCSGNAKVTAGSSNCKSLGSTTPVNSIPPNEIAVYKGDCIDITVYWNNQNYLPTIKINCTGKETGFKISPFGGTQCSTSNNSPNVMCDIGAVEYNVKKTWKVDIDANSNSNEIKCKIQ